MVQATRTGDFYLIDLGSRNGSFVNGRRVGVPMILNHRDQLTFGETTLEFYAPAAAREVAPTPLLDLDTDGIPATHLLHVRRLITVLVVDIRSFTVLTRQLDERLLSEVVGTWFRSAGEIIRDHGSWIDKYIGDAVMAVWFPWYSANWLARTAETAASGEGFTCNDQSSAPHLSPAVSTQNWSWH